jgi:hypothetical protein
MAGLEDQAAISTVAKHKREKLLKIGERQMLFYCFNTSSGSESVFVDGGLFESNPMRGSHEGRSNEAF